MRGGNEDFGGKQLRGGFVAPLERTLNCWNENTREIVKDEEHFWGQNKSQTLASETNPTKEPEFIGSDWGATYAPGHKLKTIDQSASN